MANKPAISIIGPGRVGTAIGALAARAGYDVVAIAGRDKAATRAAAKLIGKQVVVAPADQAAAAGQIVLLTVPDRAIEPLCRELSEQGAFSPGAIVVHCSGALGSDILESARTLCGCRVASMHPMMTFPTAQAAIKTLPGTSFFCEGDPAALPTLEKLVKAIGGIPARLAAPKGKAGPARAKALYHAAACLASNYLVALMDAALQLAQRSGIDRPAAWIALAPMIEATLNNITTLGPAGALTGPISRGDAEVVASHLAAIAGDKELDELYRVMGKCTLGLARKKGAAPKAQLDKVRRALGTGKQKAR